MSNEFVKQAQQILGTVQDGVFGQNDLNALKNLDAPKPVGDHWSEPPFRGVAGGANPVTHSDKALPWTAEAMKVLGLHEVLDNAALRAWLISDGHTLGNPAALPWCGDFVETCIKRALPDEPFVGALATNPYYARNWTTFGEKVDLSRGCVVVFERGPSSGHVGFAVGQDATDIYVLGGNQGDRVSIVRVAKSRLLASRWPLTWPGNPGPLAKMTSGTIPKSVNEF